VVLASGQYHINSISHDRCCSYCSILLGRQQHKFSAYDPDAEQATGVKIPQWVKGSSHGASLITHGNEALGEDPPKLIQTWRP